MMLTQSIERIEEEIDALTSSVQGLDAYYVVDKLGEGTFSSVYKAVDLHHDLYRNEPWTLSNTPRIQPRPSKPGAVYVALKRIYVTSSTARIVNELEIMEMIRYAAMITTDNQRTTVSSIPHYGLSFG